MVKQRENQGCIDIIEGWRRQGNFYIIWGSGFKDITSNHGESDGKGN